MTLVFTLMAFLVVAVAAAAAMGVVGGTLPDLATTSPFRDLPADRPVRPEDLGRLRFTPAVRGYRMAEVDRVLDRLVGELRARDEELARWRDTAVAPLVAEAPPGAWPHPPQPGWEPQPGRDLL